MVSFPREEKVGYIEDILAYLNKNVAKGYQPEGLRIVLIRQGYSKTSIDKAFEMFNEIQRLKQSKPAEPIKEPVVEPIMEEKGFFGKLKEKIFGI